MEPRAPRGLWLLGLLCCCGHGARPGAARPRLGPPRCGGPAAAFRESLNRHRYLNSLFPGENSTATYGTNQFSHLFPEEFKAIYLRSTSSRFPTYPAEAQKSISNVSLPLRFDWRDKHVVTQVRNQQTCGGCWAFSVVGAVESAFAIKGEPLEDLSVQQVIDCSYDNYGCNGGSPLNALNWLKKMKVKLVKESEYPFKAQNGLCHYFSDSFAGFSIKDYSAYEYSGQEDGMAKALLSFGPMIAVVDAVSWQDYLGGIIQHHCSSGKPTMQFSSLGLIKQEVRHIGLCATPGEARGEWMAMPMSKWAVISVVLQIQFLLYLCERISQSRDNYNPQNSLA